MRGGEQHIGLVPEDRLRAIAVMDVEIDDGDAADTVNGAGMGGADRDAVEEAEPHGAGGFGMVAGRAHGAEGGLRLARHERIHRRRRSARGPQRGLLRSGRGDGVCIEAHMAALRHVVEHKVHIVPGMDALQGLPPGLRRRAALKAGEIRPVKRGGDRAGPGRALGMAGAGVMAGGGIVDEEQRGHVESGLPAARGSLPGHHSRIVRRRGPSR